VSLKIVLDTVKPLMYLRALNFASQNREIKGREYQLQAQNSTKLLQYFELYGFHWPK